MPTKEEVWKSIVGYPNYIISNYGRVYNQYKNRELKGWLNTGGYRRVHLYNESVGRKFYVHILVLLNFVGPRPAFHDACHCDGNPSNNYLSNLRWDTRPSNYNDQVMHGTAAIGERNGASKLTNKQRKEICLSNDHRNTLAQRYSVSTDTIRRIRRGTWHLL